MNATDRSLLLAAAAVFLVLALSTAFLQPTSGLQQSISPTTYSSAAGGTRAAYLLLRDLGFSSQQWELPPESLPKGPALLIFTNPEFKPSPGEVRTLRRFVEAGGHVLFCGGHVGDFFPGATVIRPDAETRRPVPVYPLLPHGLAHGVSSVEFTSSARWALPDSAQLPVFGTAEAPAILRWSLGRGQLIWFAGADPFTNLALPRAGHLPLLLNIVQTAGPHPAILWDEYFHGHRGSLWDFVERTPWKWVCAQFALSALLLLWSRARRSGPLFEPRPLSRLAPLEFVETLGGLYRKARASALPVRLARLRLRRLLEARLGLPSSLPDSDLAAAAAERLGWEHTALLQALSASSDSALSDRLRDSAALHLVQALRRYCLLLQAPSSKGNPTLP